jgi:hypothetical protein
MPVVVVVVVAVEPLGAGRDGRADGGLVAAAAK